MIARATRYVSVFLGGTGSAAAWFHERRIRLVPTVNPVMISSGSRTAGNDNVYAKKRAERASVGQQTGPAKPIVFN